MITERGIKGNHEKIEAIRRMKPPMTKRGGVQKLTGRLASLKGSENFQWDQNKTRTSKT